MGRILQSWLKVPPPQRTMVLMVEAMDEGFGRVVNITSINGVIGAHGQSNYSAAKSGVIGLTFALAKEGEH